MTVNQCRALVTPYLIEDSDIKRDVDECLGGLSESTKYPGRLLSNKILIEAQISILVRGKVKSSLFGCLKWVTKVLGRTACALVNEILCPAAIFLLHKWPIVS